MKPKIAIVVAFAVVVAGILLFTLKSKGKSGGTVSGPGPSASGSPAPAKGTVEISMLYSTEKKEWIEDAAAQFKAQHPEIVVTLIGKGSLEAAADILEGKQKPTIWSPADTLVLNLLESDWQTKNHSDLFATTDADAPQPLVITPLVFVIWEDRANVLAKASKGPITWRSIETAVSSNQGWPAIGGKSEWGFVKLGHTDPTRSNSGLQALLLMTLEYYKKSAGLTVEELLAPEYQAWIKSLEKGVAKFESSTGTFMTDMIRFGPSKYDIAVVYENLAISQIENAQGRWGALKVYYPSITLWSDHPVALLQGDWVSDAQKTAARTWIGFLRSRPVQSRALQYGFRPADTSVPIRGGDGQNPFTRLAAQGISVDIPPVATPPEGPVVRNLMMMWTRVVGTK